MKKIVSFLVLFIFFSSLSEAFSNPFASTAVKTNIYSIMENRYKNIWQTAYSDAVSFVAWKYWVEEKYISNILKWKLIYCSIWDNNLIKQLKINLWSDYTKQDYTFCYWKIKEQIDNFENQKITHKELDDSLLAENLLANGKNDDGPYDLVVDVQNLSEVLFKKKMKKIPFWKINIWKTWRSAVNQLWNTNNSQNLINPTNPTNPTILSNSNNSTNLTNPTNSINSMSSTDSTTLKTPMVSTALSNSTNSITPTNPDVQIWNQCWNNSNSNGIVNKLKNIDNNPNNSLNLNSNVDLPNNVDSSNNVDWNNNANKNKIGDKLFDKFWLKWDKWWFIDGFFTSNVWKVWNNNLWLWWWSAWGWWCAGGDKLLSVCFQLIPSWPRWPVWWTVFVHSIEGEIDKIWDTLKDIKQSFIIPSWHGDEALDTDFESLKLANIMAFNIVLTSKPVFNFKKDKKTEQQANAIDTECKWVPHKLAVMYSRLWIAYCLDKWLDKDKYLFANISDVKPFPKPNLKPEKNDSSSDGIYNEIGNYSQLLWNILWFTNSLDKLMWTWKNSAIALEAKSE